ncbi:MAG: hypothetical protein WA733_20810, partial [Methylocystis sp.]
DDVPRRRNRPRPKSSGAASRDPPRRSRASLLTAVRRYVSSLRAPRAGSRRVLVKILRFISGRRMRAGLREWDSISLEL